MEEKRYSYASWLSFTAAALFILGWGIGFTQMLIGVRVFGYHGPVVGPSDLLFLGFSVIIIYIAVMLRRYLNEFYNFHEIDSIITASIIWTVCFQVISLLLKGFMLLGWSGDRVVFLVIIGSILVIANVSRGIIDIMKGVRLLKMPGCSDDLIKVYGYLSLVSGIAMASVILAPIGLLLIPVNVIVLGMIFLKEGECVEFV